MSDETLDEAETETEVSDEAETQEAPATEGKDGDAEPSDSEGVKGYWPEDWRDKMADDAAAGDDKAKARILKQLERHENPASIYGKARELERIFSEGNLVKMPGKDATDDQKAEFLKALGNPDNPDGFIENLKLPNDETLGEIDEPLAKSFAEAMHNAGPTRQDVFDATLSWYFNQQEQALADMDDQDEQFRNEATQALKDEFGPSFNRTRNATVSLFNNAPGGTDLDNENGLYARLMGGRMADGRKVGDDPDMIRFLAGLAREVNPIATVVESADGSGKSIEDEISDIEKYMRDNRREYFKDERKQSRYRELLEARDKVRARNAA